MQQDLSVCAAQLLEGLGSAVLAANPLPEKMSPVWFCTDVPPWALLPRIKKTIQETGASVVEYM